jgi:hypothetical protein
MSEDQQIIEAVQRAREKFEAWSKSRTLSPGAKEAFGVAADMMADALDGIPTPSFTDRPVR